MKIIRRRRPGSADSRGASVEQLLQPDIFFVTFCAVASLLPHKMRQALRARKNRLRIFPFTAHKLAEMICSILSKWHNMPMKPVILQVTVQSFVAAFCPFSGMRKISRTTVGVKKIFRSLSRAMPK